MQQFASPMSEAMERTISEALRQGMVDPKLHAAPLEALRQLAAKADEGGRDNVTLPTMLKYLTALGIVMEPAKPEAKQAEAKGEGKLSKMRRGRGNLRAV